MQKWLLTVLLLAVGFAPLAAQEPDLAAAPRVSMAEFKSLAAAGKVLVVDVRDQLSFATGHIPGARSIPLGQLLDPRSIAELKASTRAIVLYCA